MIAAGKVVMATTNSATAVRSGFREHPPVTLDEQIACVDRELGMRRKLYPRWVASGKLTQANADAELWRLEAVRETLACAKREAADRSPHAVLSSVDIQAVASWDVIRRTEMERCLRVILLNTHSDLGMKLERKIRAGFGKP